ncbi:hypothetical protein ACPPVO_23595 [Dactylosporangium sp. McL0621]|uniref:hypothetical protein n=1 Tax=Dactylosporangium sp. McL0621 TaxID=3415678 RepID=UPI003CF7CFD8
MTNGLLDDLDGRLVDTTYLHTVSWWQALRQYKWDAATHAIHRAIGMGAGRIMDHLLGPDRDRRDDDDGIRAAHRMWAPSVCTTTRGRCATRSTWH